MRSLVLLLLVGYVSGLSPVCRKGGRLRSDLNFKYTYKDSIAGVAKDVDFSQRNGEYIYCDAAGAQVITSDSSVTTACESVARAEGPGMDRFGWAKQFAVGTKGSIKVFAGDLTVTPVEFTDGDECGSTVKMALGGQYMAAVCKKGIRVYRYDGTSWSDHDAIDMTTAAVDLEFDASGNDHFAYNGQNDTDISLCTSQTYNFKRVSSGHPLRVVKESDCTGCETGTHIFPSSSVTNWVDVNGDESKAFTFAEAGTYYYLCSSHANMVGKITVSSCSLDHELKVDLNHEDYMIVSKPSTQEVKIYKLGAVTQEVQSLTGDGEVAAAVNCRGSVFAYKSGSSVKVKQLSQKDGSWSDLADISVDAVSLSMSNDVMAVGLSDKTKVYMFANGGTQYAEYKSIDIKGNKVSIEHDDLAIIDDTRVYLLNDGPSTKCLALQKLDNGVCIDCGAGHTNAHDNTETTCNIVPCSSSQFAQGNACYNCPAGATNPAGPATTDSVCSCPAGKVFNMATLTAPSCDTTFCLEDERVAGNACEACPPGTTNAAGDDASGANTTCDATLCGVNEHVVSNACANCTEGSTNVAGDDASGADTVCDPDHQCLVNQFYTVAGGCQNCPDGSLKAEAVSNLDGETSCDNIICKENEHVTSGAGGRNCTACPAGTERPAGDDATLGLTPCLCSAGTEGDGVTCTACLANQESVAGEPCKCTAGHESGYIYTANEKVYVGTSCGGDEDCKSACSADAACEGYTNIDNTSFAYGAKQADTGGNSSSKSIGCATCPANSNSLSGVAVTKCVKNEAAIWYNEVVNGPADAGACVTGLYCNTKAATNGDCIAPYEDGGVLQATTPCCRLEQPQSCLCDENHRVSSGACVACATGEVRPAGDDPDKGNTYCNTQGLTLAFTNNGNDDFVYNAQNDPDIPLKVGQLYTFLRDSAGHPLRVVSEADCPSCNTGTWPSLPTSSVSDVDSEQGAANVVWRPRQAGTYYYICTTHPNMVGKLVVTWDSCNLGGTRGSLFITSSCQFDSQVSLNGPTSISVASARLRSSDTNILVSMNSLLASAIDATIWPLSISGFEITGVTSDSPFAKSTSGTISLSGLHVKDNARNTQSGALFKTDGGGIIAQNLVVDNSKGELLEGVNGGDISLADSTISSSGDIIKQVGGAVLVRGVSVSGGGKFADIQDVTSVFEDLNTDGGEGINAVKSAVQIERSKFKGHSSAPVKFNSKDCSASQCKRELIVEGTIFEDATAMDIQTDSANKPRVKIIEGNFTNSGSVVASEGIELYVIDQIEGKEMTTTESKTESCLPYQCSHKPFATSCKVDVGKGTKCVCDIGVATYNAADSSIEKATTVNDILTMLFATGGTADRIVKLVDQNVRYIPTQETADAAKSNILLTKPTNADGEFQSEKTILLKPDTGVVCATFQTWLCDELTACHHANGTITAECDGNKILNGTSNTNGNINRRRLFQNRFFKLKAHPEDPNCAGKIVNLRQQCESGGTFYSRCVQDAQFHHDVCKCKPGLAANDYGNACVSPDNLCKVNERVLNKKCVACEGDLTNKAGSDRTGVDTTCNDVICKENYYAKGGVCVHCAASHFNLAGDIARVGNDDQPDTVCCGAGEYEFETTSTTPFRTCKSCTDTTDSIRIRFGTTGAGLHCCRGVRLGNNAEQCDRIMEYYRKVCQAFEDPKTCPAQSYS